MMRDYPRADSFEKSRHRGLNLGWLGSLSYGKNFDQALKIFEEARKRLNDLDIRFFVCGATQEVFSREKVKTLLKKHGISPKFYIHINNGNSINHERVWDFLNKIDVLLFPSTANIESSPAVLSEANHLGIPIIASEHGGGYGVVPKNNLVKTTYFDKTSDLINNQPLGKVDINDALKKVESFDRLKTNKRLIYENQDKKLLDILNNKKTKEEFKLDQKTRRFIKNIQLFLNKDYKPDINKAIKILSKNAYYDLRKTPYEIVSGLNFRVYAKLSN
jgi:glycosyltransferase involved in cell wall biosynthesis